MRASSEQWVVRTGKEQVKGPFSTEELRRMIVSGSFSGLEEVCEYPEGEWKSLLKHPDFYEALVESIENPSRHDDQKNSKMEAETVIRPAPGAHYGPKPIVQSQPEPEQAPINQVSEPTTSQSTENKKDKKENSKKKKKSKSQPPALIKKNQPLVKQDPAIGNKNNPQGPKQPINYIEQRDKNLEIQLSDIKKLQAKEAQKIFPMFLILLLLVGAALYIYFEDDQQKGTSWQLVAPAKTTEDTISPGQIQKVKKSAAQVFASGNVEDLLLTHIALAKAVEGAPKNLELMGLLCMAYQQLWPYTKQTEQDLKSIVTVTQLARSVNPISNYSDSCQIVFLLAKGQTKEAKSLLEKTLDNQVDEKFSLPPFLYYIKGEMLEAEASYLSAEAYFTQASELWPQWMTAKFAVGRMHYRLSKYSDARAAFESIQRQNPKSKAALYGLALVELKTTRQIDKAMNYFAAGYKMGLQRLHKDTHAEALLAYGKLLLDKGDRKQALNVAQDGYRLSPSNRDLRELVITLGGDEKVEGANNEVVLIGDQFARSGDHLTAQAQYKAAFEIDPKNGLAAFKAAKSLWTLNQSRDAISWLDKAIKADPDLLRAYVLKADYESQRYNFSSAAKTLSAAQNRFLNNHEVTKAQALLEFRKNNMFGAIQYGERAVRMYDSDVELLTLLAQAHIAVYLNAPNVRKEDQERNEVAKNSARRYAGRAIDLEPAWPESQITYAKLLGALDGPVRGEVYLKELIKSYPYTMEYRLALAEFYKQNEKFSDSARIYEEVVAIDNKNKKAAFGLAEAYRVLNRPELAQKFYNIASSIDPSDVEPMFANAKLLIETASGREAKAKNEQALAKLEIVKKINPEFPKVAFYMARCYLELSDYGRALEMVKEEKMRNPSIADSYILAAEIYYRQAQFKECAGEYSAAIKLRPNSAELYVKASICYRNSDSIEIAEDMLTMASERESGFADIYRETGYIAAKKGQTSKAIENLQKYLILSPNALDRDAVSGEITRLGGTPP